MIVRIHFESEIKHNKKKSTHEDTVLIHAVDVTRAKELFGEWIVAAAAIKGESGIFHPLGTEGSVKITKAEEDKATHDHKE